MGDLITIPVHTSGSIDDYFLVEGLVLSTRYADAFKAMDRASKESVSLWKVRAPMSVNSDQVRRFLNRLAVIGDMDPPVCSMLTYGVDAAGIGFAIFPSLLGRSYGERGADKTENERLFGAAVHKIEVLHNHGVLCGDISGSSFWIDRVGEPSFIAPLGAIEIELNAPQLLPPIETLHFVAPEQLSGGLLTRATDVFALGVLGYHLLTGHYPYGSEPLTPGQSFDIGQVKLPSAFGAQIPGWADSVLLKCLAPNPAERYQDAAALFRGIAEARQRQSEQQAPVRTHREETDPMRTGTTASVHAPLRMGAQHASEVKEDVPESSPTKRSSLKLTLGLVCLLLAVVVGGLIFTRPKPVVESDNKLANELRQHIEAIEDPKMRENAGDIANPQVALAAKEQKIEQIASSDDPLSHELLVKIALDAPSLAERELAEKSLLNRATRLGLKRSAEQVRHGCVPVVKASILLDMPQCCALSILRYPRVTMKICLKKHIQQILKLC